MNRFLLSLISISLSLNFVACKGNGDSTVDATSATPATPSYKIDTNPVSFDSLINKSKNSVEVFRQLALELNKVPASKHSDATYATLERNVSGAFGRLQNLPDSLKSYEKQINLIKVDKALGTITEEEARRKLDAMALQVASAQEMIQVIDAALPRLQEGVEQIKKD